MQSPLAMKNGVIDVPMGHPIFGCGNAILTPHFAYNSVEAVVEEHEKVAKSVIEVLGGNLPYNCVNRKELVKYLDHWQKTKYTTHE